jgi:hypothetical protein
MSITASGARRHILNPGVTVNFSVQTSEVSLALAISNLGTSSSFFTSLNVAFAAIGAPLVSIANVTSSSQQFVYAKDINIGGRLQGRHLLQATTTVPAQNVLIENGTSYVGGFNLQQALDNQLAVNILTLFQNSTWTVINLFAVDKYFDKPDMVTFNTDGSFSSVNLSIAAFGLCTPANMTNGNGGGLPQMGGGTYSIDTQGNGAYVYNSSVKPTLRRGSVTTMRGLLIATAAVQSGTQPAPFYQPYPLGTPYSGTWNCAANPTIPANSGFDSDNVQNVCTSYSIANVISATTNEVTVLQAFPYCTWTGGGIAGGNECGCGKMSIFTRV